MPPHQPALLALDATTEWCSVAWTDGRQWIERAEPAGQRHAELMLAMVDAVLRESGGGLDGVREIAFGAGPGSFTGLRIACGVAQGLAFARDLPVRPVSSLLALAQASGSAAVIAAIDARMDEIYWAAYQRSADGAWHTVHEPTVSPPASITIPQGIWWTGAGNAYSVYPALGAQFGIEAHVDTSVAVTARAIAELALGGYGAAVNAEAAVPQYVRDRVARTTAERRVH